MADENRIRVSKCLLGIRILRDIMEFYLDRSKDPRQLIHDCIINSEKLVIQLGRDQKECISKIPTDGFKHCDITLMYSIARHIRRQIIEEPPTNGWGNTPGDGDTTVGDDFERIRICRNQYHKYEVKREISEDELTTIFNAYKEIAKRADEKSHSDSSFQKELDDICGGIVPLTDTLEESLQQVVVYKLKGEDIKFYLTCEARKIIEMLRQRGKIEGRSRMQIVIMDINPKDIESIKRHQSEIYTEHIKIEKIESGSLVVSVIVQNEMFTDDKTMKKHLEIFLEKLTSGTQNQISGVDIILLFDDVFCGVEEQTDFFTDNSSMVLDLDVDNSVFASDESLQENITQLIDNIAGKMNGHSLHKKDKEMLAVIEVLDTGQSLLCKEEEEKVHDFLSTTDIKEKESLTKLLIEHGITLETLLKMDKKGLQDLGIKKGPVLQILKAIKEKEKSELEEMNMKNIELDNFFTKVNLKHLAPMFKEKGITIALLLEMNEEDLKKVGVAKKGNLVSILNEIRATKSSKEKRKEEELLRQFLENVQVDQSVLDKFQEEEISTKVIVELKKTDLPSLNIREPEKIKLFLLQAAELRDTAGSLLLPNTDSIDGFMKSLGYPELVKLCKEEEISMENLPLFEDSDLRDIGIKKGPRVMILSALEKIALRKPQVEAAGDAKEQNEIESIQSYKPSSKDARDELRPTSFMESESPPVCKSELAEEEMHENVEETKAQITNNEAGDNRLHRLSKVAYEVKKSADSKTRNETAIERMSGIYERIRIFETNAKKSILQVFNEIKNVHSQDIRTTQLCEELEREFPKVTLEIKEKEDEMNDSSFQIIVTGETSAGKSSFVNVLLGEKLLPESALPCTSIICRIHKSERKYITLTDMDNKTVETPLEENISTSRLKNFLKPYVCKVKTQNKDYDRYKFVDIFWPVKHLLENIVIVDTPGFGPDHPELTQRLVEYLPKALAFIYILNTPNSGGVQGDRIISLYRTLSQISSNERIQLLDSERALFICNKWDQIREDQQEVLETVKDNLRDSWPGFKDEKLYKFSAIEELQRDKNSSISPEFRAVLNSIGDMMPATIQEKFTRYLIWQETHINDLHKHLKARIAYTLKSSDEQLCTIENIKKEITECKKRRNESEKSVSKRTEDLSLELAEILHLHFMNEATQKAILFKVKAPKTFTKNKEVDFLILEMINEEILLKLKEIGEERVQIFNKAIVDEVLIKSCSDLIDDTCLDYDVPFVASENRSSTLKRNSKIFNLNNLTPENKVFIGVMSPILIPASLAVAIVGGITYGTFRTAKVAVNAVGKQLDKKKFQEDKFTYIEERAKPFFQRLTKEKINENIHSIISQAVVNFTSRFFQKKFPEQIEKAEAFLRNLQNEKNKPRQMRIDCFRIIAKINQLRGQILDVKTILINEQIKYFDESMRSVDYKSDILSWTTEQSEDRFRTYGELLNLRSLHPIKNVARMFGFEQDDTVGDTLTLRVYTEKCGTTLTRKVFEEHSRRKSCFKYMRDALEGIIYLHKAGLYHGNLSTDTVQITINDEVKVTNGGISKPIQLTGRITNPPLIHAPEMLKENPEPGFEADVFQIGIIVWEIHYTKKAFWDIQRQETFEDLWSLIGKGVTPVLEQHDQTNPSSNIKLKLQDSFKSNPDDRPTPLEWQGALIDELKGLQMFERDG